MLFGLGLGLGLGLGVGAVGRVYRATIADGLAVGPLVEGLEERCIERDRAVVAEGFDLSIFVVVGTVAAGRAGWRSGSFRRQQYLVRYPILAVFPGRRCGLGFCWSGVCRRIGLGLFRGRSESVE